MTFTGGKFLSALFITVIAGILIWAGYISLNKSRQDETAVDPAVLVQQARTALEAVRVRKSSDRRPASYDAVLAPLDKLLAQARNMVQDVNFDPVGDFQKLFERTDPVINIATDANQLAQTETGPLAKNFRFNQQKGEACQHLVSGMYSRLKIQQAQSSRPSAGPHLLPEAEVNAIMRVIQTGVEADPQNANLFYMRGIIHRDNGMFAAAALDLEKALELDPQSAASWNVLGLVYESLKQFDKAEESLERSRSLFEQQAEQDKTKLGEEYTAVVFNLARFHESLASFYARENRLTPNAENKRLAGKHSADAKKYFNEFLLREPPDSDDAKLARRLVDAIQN